VPTENDAETEEKEDARPETGCHQAGREEIRPQGRRQVESGSAEAEEGCCRKSGPQAVAEAGYQAGPEAKPKADREACRQADSQADAETGS
jgi:hypothetical protein